jgi:hypothetical protein
LLSPCSDGKSRRIRERGSAVPFHPSLVRIFRVAHCSSRTALTLAIVFALTGISRATAPGGDEPRVPEPFTSTIAGSGARGIADGAAADATFMAPTAVAVAPDGAIIVADPAAQNIRRIFAGRVTTLAGASIDGMTADERAGGYADGLATDAQFARPLAVAVARTGDVFVADAGNRCIRRISHGFVTTFSGSRAPGHADGTARVAQFDDIRGLAIDDTGILYVADYGVGVRRVDLRGNVATITRPADPKTVSSVAVRGSGTREIVAWGDATRLHLLALGADRRLQDVAYADVREPDLPELAIGRATGIAIVNENTIATTDVATDAVRLIRLPAPPYLSDRMARALAGGVREGQDLTGGFDDGPPDRARVSDPGGIALARAGVFYVADTGNRRIRQISGVDTRESVLPDASNVTPARRGYRIAVVGNSYAFYNVLWPESIPGRIEAILTRDAREIALTAHPELTVFRVDDLSSSAGRSLIHEFLGDGEVDLVIVLVNAYDPWSVDDIHAAASDLERKHTQLVLVYTPQGFEVSPLDYATATLERDVSFTELHAAAVESESFYNHAGVPSILLLDAMETWEGRADRRPLFYGADHHLTIFGSQWVGERIAEALERLRPWRRFSP